MHGFYLHYFTKHVKMFSGRKTDLNTKAKIWRLKYKNVQNYEILNQVAPAKNTDVKVFFRLIVTILTNWS